MPVRAIIMSAIYREKRFSCACRAITISLKTPSRDMIFRRFGVIGEFVVKIAPVWHSLNDATVKQNYDSNKNVVNKLIPLSVTYCNGCNFEIN